MSTDDIGHVKSPDIMNSLIGRYAYDKNENVDDYLNGLGVGLVLRKVHSVAKPELEINYSEPNKMWTIRLESVFHKHILKTKLDEEIDDETFDVRQCKTTLKSSEDGTKLIMTQKCEEGPDVETIFEKINDEVISIAMTSSNYKAIQTFKSISPIVIEDEEEDD